MYKQGVGNDVAPQDDAFSAESEVELLASSPDQPIYGRWPTALLGERDLDEVWDLDSLIGDEDREKIDASKHPHRMICSLECTSATTTIPGTGWLAGPKVVLTAGHCIDGPELGGPALSIVVRAGRNPGNSVFKSTATRFDAAPRWLNEKDPDFDYGVIFLDDPLVKVTEWFQFAALADSKLDKARVTIAGYPILLSKSTVQWYAANSVLKTDPLRVFYDVDTSEGESGAPVWVTTTNGQPLVVAIHTANTTSTPTSYGIEANSGVRITADVATQLNHWINTP